MLLINLLGKLWYGPETWKRMQEMQKAPKVRIDPKMKKLDQNVRRFSE